MQWNWHKTHRMVYHHRIHWSLHSHRRFSIPLHSVFLCRYVLHWDKTGGIQNKYVQRSWPSVWHKWSQWLSVNAVEEKKREKIWLCMCIHHFICLHFRCFSDNFEFVFDWIEDGPHCGSERGTSNKFTLWKYVLILWAAIVNAAAVACCCS